MQKFTFVIRLCFLLCFHSVFAQDNLSYQTPPQIMADILNAPITPNISLNTKGDLMLIMEHSPLPTIADLAQPELRIAGLRINPINNGPSRMPYTIGLKFKKLTDKNEIAIMGLPANLRAGYVTWSPNNSKIAFANFLVDKIELWMIDVSTLTASKLSSLAVNAAYGSPFDWVDNQTLMVKTVPTNRAKLPGGIVVPTGPAIQESLGKKGGAPTYQDLLKNPNDEKLFEYHCTSQLVKININGKSENLGLAGIIGSAEPSPDGKFVLIATTHRPFSYVVTANSFPKEVKISDINGKTVKVLTDLPLFDSADWNQDAAKVGQRSHNWRADSPAIVYWTEAQDGGDPKAKADIRDKVFTLEAPFTAAPTNIYSSKNRFAGFIWGNSQIALANESWNATRKITTKIINPSKNIEPVVLFDRSSEDRYNNPGSPELTENEFGRRVLLITKDNSLFMKGQGASSEGDRPFIDLLNLTTKQSQRLWRSQAPYYESVIAVLDGDQRTILTSRQSQEEQPNYFVRDLKKNQDALQQVTFFPNPYPMLKGVQKQLLKYKRADGVDLSTTLYLPAGYKKEDGPLPTFLWAYPAEYKTKEAAGQVSGSPYAFTRVGWGSAIYWVTQGYAILDNAAIPIVGEGDKEPNDTYIEQLVSSAKAAIDEGVRLGVVDAERVGVGGHSYGAFMTANLLSHSNLFKAGIARSGAYNRTLTPFGFQNEKRNYWQAPEVYNQMSPFMNVDKMKTPLLMTHGEADNNTGTFPIQSERYYNALKGMGATVRLVFLPYESHGYAGKESVMHMLWEMNNWLNTYVKNAKKSQ